MTDNKIDVAAKSIVQFRYADTRRTLCWILVAMLLNVVLFIAACRQGDSYGPFALLVPTFFFFGWMIFNGIRFGGDVRVTTSSISRCFGGRTLQEIFWNNVEEFIIYDVNGPQQWKMHLVIHVLAKEKPGRMLAGRKIALSDLPMNRGSFAELVALMNCHIAEHKIKITCTIGGVTSYPDRLISEHERRVG